MTGATLVALASMAAVLVVPAQTNDPARPALVLPALSHDAACPVTTGTRGEVPRQEHIFGGDLWFGRGPVRIGLAWKPAHTGDLATFSLTPVPIENGAPRGEDTVDQRPGLRRADRDPRARARRPEPDIAVQTRGPRPHVARLSAAPSLRRRPARP